MSRGILANLWIYPPDELPDDEEWLDDPDEPKKPDDFDELVDELLSDDVEPEPYDPPDDELLKNIGINPVCDWVALELPPVRT